MDLKIYILEVFNLIKIVIDIRWLGKNFYFFGFVIFFGLVYFLKLLNFFLVYDMWILLNSKGNMFVIKRLLF